jgi:hypothetical protein
MAMTGNEWLPDKSEDSGQAVMAGFFGPLEVEGFGFMIVAALSVLGHGFWCSQNHRKRLTRRLAAKCTRSGCDCGFKANFPN